MRESEERHELASRIIQSRSCCLLVRWALDSIYEGADPIRDEMRRMELLEGIDMLLETTAETLKTVHQRLN